MARCIGLLLPGVWASGLADAQATAIQRCVASASHQTAAPAFGYWMTGHPPVVCGGSFFR